MSSATGKLPAGHAPPGALARLRTQGVRGGVIPLHRSMIQLRWTPFRIVRAVSMAAAGVVAVLLLLPVIGRLWGELYEWALPLLGLSGEITWHRIGGGLFFQFQVPIPPVDAPWPTRSHWITVGAMTAGVLLLSLLLPVRYLPARYFLRFVAAVQLVSLGWFALSAPPFPYPVPGYAAGLLTAGLAVLVLVPLALGFGLYVFDHSVTKQAVVTIAIVGHLALLLPLQVLCHVVLIRALSLLVQPTLFFVFGLLVEVLVFVSLYGWAMSWTGREIPQHQKPGGLG